MGAEVGCAGARYAAGWEMLLDTHIRLVLPTTYYYLISAPFVTSAPRVRVGLLWLFKTTPSPCMLVISRA